MKVEKGLNAMEDKLLHKDYDGVHELNEQIISNLNKTMAWVFKEMRKVEQ